MMAIWPRSAPQQRKRTPTIGHRDRAQIFVFLTGDVGTHGVGL
jgi:hypothetical protein